MLGSITVGEIANLVLGIEYGKYEIELGYLKDKIEEYSFSFLQKRWNKHYQELSGGERKLVQLVLFLQIKRDLVVLDEPTAFLDRENVNNVFHVINANKDRTYLIITHDVRDLLLVNDYHLLSMDNHKIDHEFNKKTFENVNRDNSFLHYFAEV